MWLMRQLVHLTRRGMKVKRFLVHWQETDPHPKLMSRKPFQQKCRSNKRSIYNNLLDHNRDCLKFLLNN